MGSVLPALQSLVLASLLARAQLRMALDVHQEVQACFAAVRALQRPGPRTIRFLVSAHAATHTHFVPGHSGVLSPNKLVSRQLLQSHRSNGSGESARFNIADLAPLANDRWTKVMGFDSPKRPHTLPSSMKMCN